MTRPLQGTAAYIDYIPISLTLPKTRDIGLQCRHSVGLFSFTFSWWASKHACVSETECIMALQGHPRSLNLALIESAHATWSSIVTLILSCPVSEILQVFCWGEWPQPPFHPIIFFGCVPLGLDCRFCQRRGYYTEVGGFCKGRGSTRTGGLGDRSPQR